METGAESHFICQRSPAGPGPIFLQRVGGRRTSLSKVWNNIEKKTSLVARRGVYERGKDDLVKDICKEY